MIILKKAMGAERDRPQKKKGGWNGSQGAQDTVGSRRGGEGGEQGGNRGGTGGGEVWLFVAGLIGPRGRQLR